MTLRAVIFDYYETLAQLTNDLRERAFDLLAEQIGVDLPPGEAYCHWRELTANDATVRFNGVRPPLDGDAPAFITFSDVWRARYQQLFLHWKASALPDVGADAYARAHAEAIVYPDVRAALDELRKHYRLAVLSDADVDFLEASIERNRIEFETVVSSEEVGAYKPHIAMFRAVCERLAIAPNEAAYVGDTPWADMAGARNAGMRSIWMNRHGLDWPAGQEPPDATIRSLSELHAQLDG